jgi:hypothetical protein
MSIVRVERNDKKYFLSRSFVLKKGIKNVKAKTGSPGSIRLDIFTKILHCLVLDEGSAKFFFMFVKALFISISSKFFFNLSMLHSITRSSVTKSKMSSKILLVDFPFFVTNRVVFL